MLQWYDGSRWNHRAYWGANNIAWGIDGTTSRRYMGPLPAAGKWVRLEVPAAQVGLDGKSVSGMAFTLYDGRATWDRAGIATCTPPSAAAWVEDAVPRGAMTGGNSEGWNWTSTNPPPFSGALAHQSALAAGLHQHYFYWSTRLRARQSNRCDYAVAKRRGPGWHNGRIQRHRDEQRYDGLRHVHVRLDRQHACRLDSDLLVIGAFACPGNERFDDPASHVAHGDHRQPQPDNGNGDEPEC